MTDSLDEDLPLLFGPYRRLHVLGAGGMGAIFEVVHQETGGHYALKVIRPESIDAATTSRLRREAEIMASLDHPNLARIHTAHLSPPIYYLILDLYPRGTLNDRTRHGPLGIEDASLIAKKLAAGLAHAHKHGVIHRDIKPENVLFNERDEPVLADFGLGLTSNAERMTRTGEILGTPLFMAPEQALDGKRAGPEADVYALGGLLYLMLSGQTATEPGSSLLETLDRVCNMKPRPLSELRRGVPPPLEAWCMHALAKNPEDRPTAASLALGWQPPKSGISDSRWTLALGLLVACVLVAISLFVAQALVTPKDNALPPSGRPSEVPQRLQAAALPYSWIRTTHDRQLLLSILEDDVNVSVLFESSFADRPDGSTEWTLTPARVQHVVAGVASARDQPEAWLGTPNLEKLDQVLRGLRVRRGQQAAVDRVTVDRTQTFVSAVVPNRRGWLALHAIDADRVAGHLSQACRPPYRIVGSEASPTAYSRPWGSPLGNLSPTLGYLKLASEGEWTAVGWKAGEAWVPSAQLSRSNLARWVGIVTAKKSAPLRVRAEGNESAPVLGSLRHAQAVALPFVMDSDPFEYGGRYAQVPTLSHWCGVTWGETQGWLKGTVEEAETGYTVYVFLVAPEVEQDASYTQGSVPEAPSAAKRRAR